MAITSTFSADSGDLVIAISGRFDFSSHQEFRGVYENVDVKSGAYVIDLANSSYLDSSALGMLLMLRDYAGGDEANVSIINCNNDVKKILNVSNFEQLFTIK